MPNHYQISFYVPETHCDQVKQALFEAGAGKLGNYDSCAWQTAGRGQFRPLEGSDPFLGKTGKLEFVDELKVELLCEETALQAALKALMDSHPYETPAYSIVKLEQFDV